MAFSSGRAVFTMSMRWGEDRGYEDKHLHFGKAGHAAQVKLKHIFTNKQADIHI